VVEAERRSGAKTAPSIREKMDKKPQLIVSQWVRGQPLGYECSLCAQTFMLPEGLSPRESAARLIAEFQDHIKRIHPEKE
jgi:hypothetical protein